MISWKKLVDKKQVDEITFLKCQLGLATFFLEISKALVIYSLAYILGIMFEVIIYHIGYIMLRSSGLGAHAKTNNSCLFYSIVLIMGIPWLILVSNIMIGKPILIILWIINFCILAKYAPSTTMKNPIKDEKLKSKMRKRALLANLVLGLPLLVLPIGLAQLVIVGSTVGYMYDVADYTSNIQIKQIKSEGKDNDERSIENEINEGITSYDSCFNSCRRSSN